MSEQSNLERYRAERENRESERRTAIVDTAEALFLERGIVDTTMMDIADRAGVSRVTLTGTSQSAITSRTWWRGGCSGDWPQRRGPGCRRGRRASTPPEPG